MGMYGIYEKIPSKQTGSLHNTPCGTCKSQMYANNGGTAMMMMMMMMMISGLMMHQPKSHLC